MKHIIYSPEYRNKILDLREYLILEFGENTAKKLFATNTVSEISLLDNYSL